MGKNNFAHPAGPVVDTCELCGGDVVLMGRMGSDEHYRCRSCDVYGILRVEVGKTDYESLMKKREEAR